MIADNPYYSTSQVMKLLGCGKNKACDQIKIWKAELKDMGFYPGARGQIPKSYVDEKLYKGGNNEGNNCNTTTN